MLVPMITLTIVIITLISVVAIRDARRRADYARWKQNNDLTDKQCGI